MTQININFKIPKKFIKKINSIFNLDTLNSDTYKLIVLENTDSLILNDLDVINSTILAKESSNYTKPTVELELTESNFGYDIESEIIEVTANGVVSCKGFIIYKDNIAKDILCAWFNDSSIDLNDSFYVSPQNSLIPLVIV